MRLQPAAEVPLKKALAVEQLTVQLLDTDSQVCREPREPISDFDPEIGRAIARVDDMDDVWIRVIAASWKRPFPDQAQYVVGDLSAAKGTEAVLNMSRILGRLMAMESSAEREATRQQDTTALALLAQRGIEPAERTEAAALVEYLGGEPARARRARDHRGQSSARGEPTPHGAATSLEAPKVGADDDLRVNTTKGPDAILVPGRICGRMPQRDEARAILPHAIPV